MFATPYHCVATERERRLSPPFLPPPRFFFLKKGDGSERVFWCVCCCFDGRETEELWAFGVTGAGRMEAGQQRLRGEESGVGPSPQAPRGVTQVHPEQVDLGGELLNA